MWHDILFPSAHASGLTALLTVLALMVVYTMAWALVRGILKRQAVATCLAIGFQAVVWALVVWYAAARGDSVNAVLVVTAMYGVTTLLVAAVLYVAGLARLGRRVTYYSILFLVAVMASSVLYDMLLATGGLLPFTALWMIVVGGATYLYDVRDAHLPRYSEKPAGTKKKRKAA